MINISNTVSAFIRLCFCLWTSVDWASYHGPPYIKFTYSTKDNQHRGPGLISDSPCGVWGRGGTTCPLHDAPPLVMHIYDNYFSPAWMCYYLNIIQLSTSINGKYIKSISGIAVSPEFHFCVIKTKGNINSRFHKENPWLAWSSMSKRLLTEVSHCWTLQNSFLPWLIHCAINVVYKTIFQHKNTND